ncbi:MAG: MBL fold metallo-hydrolase [Archaeoglobaceae archaeon]
MEIDDGIFLIPGKNWGKYPSSNCIYIKDFCLIDCSDSAQNLKPKIILNSHWHEDHIAMNGVAEKVYAHELDKGAIENYEEFEKRYGMGEAVKLFLSLYQEIKFRKVDETFTHGEILNFGNVEIEVLHTPGHSAGHCCFLINGNILFLADIDLSSFGPWYGCLDSDVGEFVKSIKFLQKYAQEIKIAIPAHGKYVNCEEFEDRLEKYKYKIIERDRKIKEALKKNLDPVGMGIIYRRFPEPENIYRNFERIMVEKHLHFKPEEEG